MKGEKKMKAQELFKYLKVLGFDDDAELSDTVVSIRMEGNTIDVKFSFERTYEKE